MLSTLVVSLLIGCGPSPAVALDLSATGLVQRCAANPSFEDGAAGWTVPITSSQEQLQVLDVAAAPDGHHVARLIADVDRPAVIGSSTFPVGGQAVVRAAARLVAGAARVRFEGKRVEGGQTIGVTVSNYSLGAKWETLAAVVPPGASWGRVSVAVVAAEPGTVVELDAVTCAGN